MDESSQDGQSRGVPSQDRPQQEITQRENRLSPELYTIIMWYQQAYPQGYLSSSEVAGYLLKEITDQPAGKKAEPIKQFFRSFPSENQKRAAAKLLLIHHEKASIRTDIPLMQISYQVFSRSKEQGSNALMQEIEATPLGKELKQPAYLNHQYTGNEGRILEFIEKGGEWVNIVKSSCSGAGEALRGAPEELREEYRKGKIWERAHGYINVTEADANRIPEEERVHSSLPALAKLSSLEDSSRRKAVYASVTPEFIADNYVALETFLSRKG